MATLKIKFLGSSGSFTRPLFNCRCKACSKPTKRDYRRNTAILVNDSVLFDCGLTVPWVLRELKVKDLDAVFITHTHLDHMLGLYDLMIKKERIPLYADKKTIGFCEDNFQKRFHDNYEPHLLKQGNPVEISGLRITPIEVFHTTERIKVYGFIIEDDTSRVFFVPNYREIKTETRENLYFLDLVIADGSYIKGSFTHASWKDSVDLFLNKLGCKRLILTHLSECIPHAEQRDRIRNLSKQADVSYDGQEIDVYSDGLNEVAKSAIYLQPPHGELFWRGEKNLIIKSKRFEKYLGVPIFVASGDKIYGIIRITKIGRIDLNDFKRLADRHKITEEERKQWWPGKRWLYEYEFERIKVFNSPKRYHYKRGYQTFIRRVRFLSVNDLLNLIHQSYRGC